LTSWVNNKKCVLIFLNAFRVYFNNAIDAKINSDVFDAMCEKASTAFAEMAAVKS
jgi:hypothetical protein